MVIPLTRQFERYYTAMQTGFVLLVLLFIVAFVYVLVLLSIKLLGIVLFLGGLWMLLYFPWQAEYQRVTFTNMGRLIGIVLIAVGIILIIYG